MRWYAFLLYFSMSWTSAKYFFSHIDTAFSLKYSFTRNFGKAITYMKLAFVALFDICEEGQKPLPTFYWRHYYRQHDLIGALPRGCVYYFKKKYEKYSHKYWLPEAVMRRAIETGYVS